MCFYVFFNLTFSGASDVHILAKQDAIKEWRRLMGPTKVYQTLHLEPDSIRGQYGLTDTRNATHGSGGFGNLIVVNILLHMSSSTVSHNLLCLSCMEFHYVVLTTFINGHMWPHSSIKSFAVGTSKTIPWLWPPHEHVHTLIINIRELLVFLLVYLMIKHKTSEP